MGLNVEFVHRPDGGMELRVVKNSSKDKPMEKDGAKGTQEAPPVIEGKTKAKSKGFSHPALKAMGIPTLRVPSRNWLIFWAVTGTIAGWITYDRYERKRVREQWKQRVSYLASQKMNPLEMPRKVTVYVAPPPGDYLDASLTHFRQYIKPVLTASATDFDLRTESRQGEIRHRVAEEIRNRRRAELGLETSDPEFKDELDRTIESGLQYDNTGGVICVGRGAYKEYMHGLQEGWLGPLEQPADLQEDATTNSDDVAAFPTREDDMRDIMGEKKEEEEPQQHSSEPETLDQQQEKSASDNENEEKTESSGEGESEEKKEKQAPVPKPYIPLTKFSEAELSAEFRRAADQGNMADPMAIINQPHILGFLNTPIRLYRFFNRRYLADRMGAATAAVVFAQTRPFTKEDDDACIQEEDDWPKKWKQKGLDKGSEWMVDLQVDDRIRQNLRIYELPNELPKEAQLPKDN
jgi:import inner membrane translocase subunit TIM54